ncbi:MAG: thioredoxin family protein [Oscillospiraceae bacterium]|nr:thioredoxin family protein [Oscillospiraceae bacterium]
MNISANDFTAQVLQAAGPVLVDFYGEQCMPCKMLKPILQEVAQEQPGLKICYFSTDIDPTESKADIDAKFAVLGEHNVMSLPTLVIFNGGRAVVSQIGFMNKEQLLAWLAENGAV